MTSSATSWQPSPRCGRRELRVVVDTNVWVSGLILPGSRPGRVIEAARQGRIAAVASWELAEELAEVLRRPQLEGYGIRDDDVEDLLLLLAPMLPTVDVEVELRDPDDAPVVAAAVAGSTDAIVTGDRDVLADEALRTWLAARGVRVYSRRELVDELGAE